MIRNIQKKFPKHRSPVESNQIFYDAYNTTKAEIAAAQQTTAPAKGNGGTC